MPKFQNQTIVVPFDFSVPAKNAVRQASEWADESNTIHLIYVVIPTPTVIDMNPPVWIPPNLDTDAQENMLTLMKEIFPANNNNNFRHHTVIGDPGTEIVRLAENEQADVIIMPSHGRTGLSRLFLGSVAERVLRLARCPVLVLRGEKFENDNAESEEVTAAS